MMWQHQNVTHCPQGSFGMDTAAMVEFITGLLSIKGADAVHEAPHSRLSNGVSHGLPPASSRAALVLHGVWTSGPRGG